jgi:pimeloyl-ACP methyl ester carboxylesterase
MQQRIRGRRRTHSFAALPLLAVLGFCAAMAVGAQTPEPQSKSTQETSPPSKPAPGLQDKVFVESAGTRLFVELRGPKKSAPVLLYLHEGPANAVGALVLQAYPGPELEKRFIVAYLHQRGVLHSPEVPESTQSISNHLRDIDAVVDYLRQRFGTPRVNLLGYSWGGTLGYLYLLRNQAKIGKFVAVAAPFNIAANQLASYEMTLQWARDANAHEAVSELVALGPPPYRKSEELLTKSLWSAEAYGNLAKNLDMQKVLEAGGYDQYDTRWADAQLAINKAMFTEIQKVDVENDVLRITTPLLLIAGRHDAEVPYFSLKAGLDNWGGEKEFIVFDRGGHIPFVDETDRFVREVTRFLGS